jgi:hypothetical protein
MRIGKGPDVKLMMVHRRSKLLGIVLRPLPPEESETFSSEFSLNFQFRFGALEESVTNRWCRPRISGEDLLVYFI